MKAEIDSKDIARHLTVTLRLKRTKQWGIRLRIATLLIRLAAWIGWFNYAEAELGQE